MIAMLHAGVSLREWSWPPAVVAPLAVTAVAYTAGARRLSAAPRKWEIASFVAGMLTLAVALLSPLHAASEQSFAAHMIQHELLMVVAAPLILLGRPGLVMLWALPLARRQQIGEGIRSTKVRAMWRILTRPFDAWLLHALAIWLWHMPPLFDHAVSSDVVHSLQHVSFVGTALLFWWTIIHPRQRAALGASVMYLFTTAVHTSVLGALLTFARTSWYSSYTAGTSAWGLTAIQDQQIAGLIMWIPASLAYLVAALLVLRRWLRESEWRVTRHERSAIPS